MSAMATPAHTQLEFVHAFGVARDIRECVAFHTDAGVLYPVGRHVAVQNTVTNAMHVLPQSPGLKKLLALQIWYVPLMLSAVTHCRLVRSPAAMW